MIIYETNAIFVQLFARAVALSIVLTGHTPYRAHKKKRAEALFFMNVTEVVLADYYLRCADATVAEG